MTSVRCLLGRHDFRTRVAGYRIRRVNGRPGPGWWTLRKKCSRCPKELIVEGPAHEVKAGLRSR